jgi:hypothetical protein
MRVLLLLVSNTSVCVTRSLEIMEQNLCISKTVTVILLVCDQVPLVVIVTPISLVTSNSHTKLLSIGV